MSAYRSPLKSPACTSTQVAAVLHVAHLELANELPVDSATHHSPPCNQRPAMSSLPSPLKSPTLTSTQVAAVLQVVHSSEPTYHWPVFAFRTAVSVCPSPKK